MESESMTDGPELVDGDIVRVTYTAHIPDTGRVIDTTDTEVADEADIAGIEADGPIAVVLGEGHLFEPVEEAIKEGGIGDSRRVTVEADDGFGEVDPTDHTHIDIDRIPDDQRERGARLTYNGRTGFVESLDEEGATINFNHPLAGMAIEYDLTVQERIEEPLERVRAVLQLYDLADEVEISFDTLDVSDLQITVSDPTGETWETEKRRALADLRDALSIESIAVIETYGEAP